MEAPFKRLDRLQLLVHTGPQRAAPCTGEAGSPRLLHVRSPPAHPTRACTPDALASLTANPSWVTRESRSASSDISTRVSASRNRLATAGLGRAGVGHGRAAAGRSVAAPAGLPGAVGEAGAGRPVVRITHTSPAAGWGATPPQWATCTAQHAIGCGVSSGCSSRHAPAASPAAPPCPQQAPNPPPHAPVAGVHGLCCRGARRALVLAHAGHLLRLDRVHHDVPGAAPCCCRRTEQAGPPQGARSAEGLERHDRGGSARTISSRLQMHAMGCAGLWVFHQHAGRAAPWIALPSDLVDCTLQIVLYGLHLRLSDHLMPQHCAAQLGAHRVGG